MAQADRFCKSDYGSVCLWRYVLLRKVHAASLSVSVKLCLAAEKSLDWFPLQESALCD
jgi:hypothetical protein